MWQACVQDSCPLTGCRGGRRGRAGARWHWEQSAALRRPPKSWREMTWRVAPTMETGRRRRAARFAEPQVRVVSFAFHVFELQKQYLPTVKNSYHVKVCKEITLSHLSSEREPDLAVGACSSRPHLSTEACSLVPSSRSPHRWLCTLSFH